MNRKLRAALLIVAMVSIAIALYYPATQYLEGKALDDEMLTLRRMKADAVDDVSDFEPLPGQTVQGAFPERTPGDAADHGLETSETGAGTSGQAAELEISNGASGKPDGVSTDRMAETDLLTGGTTDRTAEPTGAAGNNPGQTVAAGESTGDASDRKAETGESAEGTTSRATAAEDGATDKTDRNAKGSGPAHSADEIAGKQTLVGQEASPEPGVTDSTLPVEENAPGLDATPASAAEENAPGLDAALIPVADSTPAPAPLPEPEPAPFVFDEARILPEYKALYEENPDLVGWLKIDGTMVDYPVLQRADEEYYLTRDFYGSSNSNGQLILDAQCDPYTPDVNVVISGHDMKSGKMFGTLQRYASERFGRQHPIVEFDTLFRRGRYRLVAVFQTSDYLKWEDGFRYNVDIRYRLELKKYLEEMDQIKLYDTGVPVEFGDQLITLSTCSTQMDDGRFVVVARRLREGEQP